MLYISVRHVNGGDVPTTKESSIQLLQMLCAKKHKKEEKEKTEPVHIIFGMICLDQRLPNKPRNVLAGTILEPAVKLCTCFT